MESLEQKVILAVMLLLYVVAISFIGYRSRMSRTSEDYFLASRSLPSWLLAITFIASWWGGGSAVDLVDQANREGLSTFWIYGVPVLLATGLMYLFAGGIRRIGTISQPELLERRYDGRSALMLTIFIVIFMTIGAAVQVIVVGEFFSSFFGVSYSTGAIIGTLMVVVYSYFGGFRGVVLTDLLQFVFFLFAAIFVFYLAYSRAGGFEPMVAKVAANDSRDGFLSFMHNIENNIAYVITFGTSWIIQANVWQRISAARTPQAAKGMMAISFWLFIPLYLVVTLTGMLSYVSYDEVPEGGVVSSMLLSLDSPVLSGLLFVGLCSAIMSTMDSMFNTGAMSLTVDIYKRYINPRSEPRNDVRVGRLSTMVIAMIALYIGINIRSVLVISWVGADFIATGAFVPLIAGLIWRRATSRAALYTMIFGVIFSSYNMAVALGAPLPVAWDIASAKQAIVGVGIALVIFVVTSLLDRAEYRKADEFIADLQLFKTK